MPENLNAPADGEDAREADLSYQQKQALEKELREALQRKLVFLLTGRTGVGKSSTINTLMGKEIAPVGDFEPVTPQVIPYETRIGEIACTVIDTPGLCDDLPEKGNDDRYLNEIREKVQTLDCVWFVTPLDETRVRSDEMRGIQMISAALGKELWEHAIIVFTFSNNVQPERFKEMLEVRTSLIRKQIARYAAPGVADAIPAVAVDNLHEYTHDGRQWLGRLYLQMLKRISGKGAQPFTLALLSRVEVDDTTAIRSTSSSGWSSSSYSAPIRVTKSEFREAMESTWREVKHLASVSVERAAASVKSAWSAIKSWF
jgi:GTP-binding protein EngB required for normal cell division